MTTDTRPPRSWRRCPAGWCSHCEGRLPAVRIVPGDAPDPPKVRQPDLCPLYLLRCVRHGLTCGAFALPELGSDLAEQVTAVDVLIEAETARLSTVERTDQ